jgi:hypothetical protein
MGLYQIRCVLSERIRPEDIILRSMKNGTFPSPRVWKRTLKDSFHTREENQWRGRLQLDSDCVKYKQLQEQLRPNIWWLLSKYDPNLLHHCRTVVRLCALTPGQSETICASCGCETRNRVYHIMNCSTDLPHTIREQFWTQVIDSFGVNVYIYTLTIIDTLT